jgi:hypothetical protein
MSSAGTTKDSSDPLSLVEISKDMRRIFGDAAPLSWHGTFLVFAAHALGDAYHRWWNARQEKTPRRFGQKFYRAIWWLLKETKSEFDFPHWPALLDAAPKSRAIPFQFRDKAYLSAHHAAHDIANDYSYAWQRVLDRSTPLAPAVHGQPIIQATVLSGVVPCPLTDAEINQLEVEVAFEANHFETAAQAKRENKENISAGSRVAERSKEAKEYSTAQARFVESMKALVSELQKLASKPTKAQLRTVSSLLAGFCVFATEVYRHLPSKHSKAAYESLSAAISGAQTILKKARPWFSKVRNFQEFEFDGTYYASAHEAALAVAELVLETPQGIRRLPDTSKIMAGIEQELAAVQEVADESDFGTYVTLDQMAAIVNRGKRTLERLKTRKRNPLPDPDVEGGAGRPDEWIWPNVRSWLENEFGKQLPEHFPADRFRRS